MHDKFEHFWAGTESSFLTAIEAADKASTKMGAFNFDSEAEDAPSLLTVHGNVGIVQIHGPLVSGSAGWMAMFGVTGYDDIREAMVQAVNDSKVSAILLDVKSGGGSVAGVDDTAAFIASIDKSIKPVYTFTDGMMASAAYWLGSSGRKVFATATSIVGSIGVLTKHSEYSQMDKKDGITNTIIRAGKYKALVNSVEPLTETAKAEVQSQVNDIYDIFLARVAENRKVSVTAADTRMGQGKEFLGKRALEAGLIDKVATFEEALTFVQSSIKGVDSGKSLIQNAKKQEGRQKMSKATLSEQQLAAIQAGADIEASLEALADQSAELDPLAESVAEAMDEEVQEESTEAEHHEEDSDEEEGEAPKADASSEQNLVAFLRAELKEARTELQAANFELRDAKAKLEQIEASHDDLQVIAQNSIRKMNIAMGGRDVSCSLSGTELVAEHKRCIDEFTAKFKVGGVAATAPASKGEGKATPYNPQFAALVQAAKSGK